MAGSGEQWPRLVNGYGSWRLTMAFHRSPTGAIIHHSQAGTGNAITTSMDRHTRSSGSPSSTSMALARTDDGAGAGRVWRRVLGFGMDQALTRDMRPCLKFPAGSDLKVRGRSRLRTTPIRWPEQCPGALRLFCNTKSRSGRESFRIAERVRMSPGKVWI